MTPDEAINVMEKYTDVGSEVVNEAHKMAIHALELQKTYENIINVTSDSCSQRGCNKCDEYRKALEHQKWIPCSERMPEEANSVYRCSERVLIISENYGINTAQYLFEKKIWVDQAMFVNSLFNTPFEFGNVLYWKSLPEPYREE